ncbi:MAG: hypothetical protein AB8B50_13915 [Pirellulaceae bacterium]
MSRRITETQASETTQSNNTPFSFAALADSTPLNELPRTCGPYQLIERIGEGGMGMVYRAVLSNPIRRAVAVKLIEPGMGSREVLSLFQLEHPAIALMQHPNIATIFDAGQAGDS